MPRTGTRAQVSTDALPVFSGQLWWVRFGLGIAVAARGGSLGAAPGMWRCTKRVGLRVEDDIVSRLREARKRLASAGGRHAPG